MTADININRITDPITEELKTGNNPDHVDYVMKGPEENRAGGVCHARGVNSDTPHHASIT